MLGGMARTNGEFKGACVERGRDGPGVGKVPSPDW